MIPPRWLGWVLTSVTFVVALASSYGPSTYDMSLPASILASIGASAAVRLGGVRPVLGLGIAAAVTAALPILGSTFDAMTLVLVFVGFQATVKSSLSTPLLSVILFGALTINDIWLRVAFDDAFLEASIAYPAIWTALAVGLGVQSRKVRLQHEQLQELHDVDRRRAVSEERRRIARDLHDVAAHHLSALVVRNKLALRLDAQDAHDELRQAVDFTADTAADALDSIRHVVQVLSTEDPSPLTPQPSFADMDGVFQRMESGGLRIVQSRKGTVREAPREVEVATVRILQEALANVLRHRGPGLAWVSVAHEEGELLVTVEDDGPTVWNPDVRERSWYRPGSYGLIGMRERAEACGGRFDVGPSERGGWRVTAALPIGRL